MLFSKLSSFAAMVILTVATPSLGQCDTSSEAMCCISVGSADSPEIAPTLSDNGVVVQDVNVPVGVGCSPVTDIGTGGTGCATSLVCCTDTSHGTVAIGCLPIG